MKSDECAGSVRGRDGGRLAEAQPARGEAVEPRRPRRGIAVGAEAVGAQRVEGDDEQVGGRRAPPREQQAARDEHGQTPRPTRPRVASTIASGDCPSRGARPSSRRVPGRDLQQDGRAVGPALRGTAGRSISIAIPSRRKEPCMIRRVLGTWTLLLLIATPLLAQRTTGSIVGHGPRRGRRRAARRHGQPRPAPTSSGTQTATTNADGVYRFLNLPPGAYDVTFALTGFKTLTSTRPARRRRQRGRRRAPRLEVSQRTEQVEVVARGAGGGHAVQRGGHQLRPRLGGERAPAAQQLLRPGGVGARRAARRRRQHAARWCTAPPTTRTPSRWTGWTSPTTTSTRPSPSPTPTPSRRWRSCPWARPPSTAT